MNAVRLSRIAELTGNKLDILRNDLKVTCICRDSRKALPGCAFFCIPGALYDGHDYALQAYEKGCRIFICERMPSGFPQKGTRVFICRNKSCREALADISAEFYGHPEKDMTLIGITGTKGKTTVAHMIYSVLNGSGMRAGYIGTNGVRFEGFSCKTSNTTPDSCELYEYLRLMRDNKVRIAVIEVSSQALMTGRIRGLSFDTCVFTNIYPDHIGEFEHKSMEHYMACKKLLFSEHCKRFAIINADSPNADEFISAVPNGVTKLGYSINRNSEYKGELIGLCRDERGLGTEFLCTTSKESVGIRLCFPGDFSVMNALAAMAVCRIYGVSLRQIAERLADTHIEGRCETIRHGEVDYVIDYAHNGESLRSVLSVIRKYRPSRLICVFGSVGGRTRGRRIEMGEVAASLADISILTSDNPDNESPDKIIDEIASCYKDDQYYLKIADRSEAIKRAVSLAKPGDIVLLAGKGHESYQLVCGERIPFSEKAELKKAFEAEC